MIATLERLRDIGNTVIVVEHDEDTIRAADHIVEMGPGPGVHGGEVVVQGDIGDVLACKASPTGQFLSGKRQILAPKRRRKGNGKTSLAAWIGAYMLATQHSAVIPVAESAPSLVPW